MKKNILLTALALISIFSTAFAANVTVQDAQNVALNFFKITTGAAHNSGITATLQYTRTEADNTVDFYVFDISPAKGFVIVSATDNDEPIIGYSTESAFPVDFSKIGLNELLNRWSEQLHYVILNNRIATATAAPHWSAYRQGVAPAAEKATSVSPLCQTTWDQNTEYSSGPNLYNNYCPGGTGANQAVTGCVATAMAQIMKYWAYPAKGTGSSSYTDGGGNYQENYGTLSCNYADSTFLWATMPLTLTNTSTTAQIDAIGTIMKCAGVSVDMDYSPNGSGALVFGSNPSAQYSYVHYFGYKSGILAVGLSGTSAQSANVTVASAAFIDSIEAELNAGRLVQMQGTDQTNGGHTWVLDGYNSSNQFHMNWGWSGYADGYFAITSLNPNDGEQLNFTEDIGVLTHIQPPSLPSTTTITEQANAALTSVCAGTSTQLSATTHTGATYSWSPTTGLSSSIIANPVATPASTTTYTVTADSAGVTATSSVTINVNPAPSASVSASSNPACAGSANGTITISASGGSGSYSYIWSNGQTTAVASGLAQGTYTLTVTDGRNCSVSVSKTLSQPAALSVTTAPVSANCGQSNGSVSTSVSGGTSTYSYAWSNNATTATLSNLAAGTYILTVTDAHNCSATSTAVVNGSGSLNVVTNATAASCYGASTGAVSVSVSGSTGSVSYRWSNGATTSTLQNVAANTYTVTVADGSGCSVTSSRVVSQPAIINVTVNSINAGCGMDNGSASASVTGGTGSYSYRWSNNANTATITNVGAGTYTVSVTDANNCSVVNVAEVAQGSTITASVTSTDATCFNDNNGGGVVTALTGTSPYVYNWSNGSTTQSVSDLGPGSYTVTVTDVNHCTTTEDISVTQPQEIQINTSSNGATGTDNGSASVSGVSGGVAPYTYSWSNGSTGQTISNLAPGSYIVTVTDAHGCTQNTTVMVGGTTGTGNLNNTIAFSIYPNPARSQAVVQVGQVNTGTTLFVRNILGQTVIEQPVSAAETVIDLNDFATGVYLVELRQGEKLAVKQLVVTK